MIAYRLSWNQSYDVWRDMAPGATSEVRHLDHLTPQTLTPDEVDFFYRQGFLVIRSVFAHSDVRLISQAMDRLAHVAQGFTKPTLYRGSQFVVSPNAEKTGARIDRIVWAGGAEPILSQLGQDPRIVSLAGQLLERNRMEQLINQLHYKLPGDQVAFPWHQDSSHRRYGTPEWTDVDGRGSFVETITAVDPMALDNGPLLVIPGSNRQGHIDKDPITGRLPAGSFDPSSAVPITLSPGDVLLLGPYTIHSSRPNTGAHARRVFLNGFAVPGANRRVYPGKNSGRTVVIDELFGP